MTPVVAIAAPGEMGAAIARRLVDHDVKVVTSLSGRGPESVARAARAGIQDVPFEQLTQADFLLSIVPPSAARPFAERVAPLLLKANPKPVFVDCNALSPETVRNIGAILSGAQTPFVDASIIGLPPKPGHPGPRFYASGEESARFVILREYGLDVHVVEGPVGAASALKLAFAGINKGLTTVATAMLLAATRNGVERALHAELAERWPVLFELLSRQIPDMPHKAYRWVAEMREIAEFAGPDTAVRQIYTGAAELYTRIAADLSGDAREVAALTEFFET